MSSRQDEINSPEVQCWQRGGTGGRWGTEGPSLVSSDLLPFPHFCIAFSLPCSQGTHGQEAGRAPTAFHRNEPKPREPANKPQTNPALDTGQTDAPNKDSQGLISKGLSLSEPACLLLIEWGCIWCLCWCQSWLVFFSASHYRKKGTSVVFKESGEENPTDSICLMTALAHSLWKWWAANDVNVGKNPKHVCFLLSLKSSGLRRGCRNNHCLGNQGSI